MKWKSIGAAVLAAILGSIWAYFNLGYGGEQAACDGERPGGGGERVLVGVLSARHHRAQRYAIRATWWPLLTPAGARGVFVLGDTACRIAEVCRRDALSCRQWQPDINISAGEQSLEFGRVAGDPAPAAAAVTFVVRHPVVVRGVAGLTAALTSAQLQTADGGLVAAAERQQGSDRAPLTAHLLPAGFLGRLVAVPPPQQRCELWRPPADGPLLVTSLVLSDGRQVPPGMEPLCWPLRLIFSIHEPERLAAELAARPDSCLVTSDVTSDQLRAEAEQHGDLVLVPGVDVYRNLPDKLLGFFSWASEYSSAEYVIKCDDDVILDVRRIVRHLPDHGRGGVWWGSFRYNWPLDRYGKWAEYQYQAEVYPPFACGTASLLSSSVVRWLAESAPHLTRFQGEDVSLGLWLAGHRLRRLHDPGWWCGGPESDATGAELYSRGQLAPAQLRQLWRCLNTTSSLRSCHTAP